MIIQPREYQHDMISKAREAIADGYRRIILSLPTGGGKTVIASAIIDSATQRGHRSLFLAHRQELIDQASRKLTHIGLDAHGVIMGDHWRQYKYSNAPVQVASVQTLARRIHKTNMAFDLEIVDECHHATAGSYRKIHDAIPDTTPRIGITATPWAANGKPLSDAFDLIIEGPTTTDLIDMGYLCPYEFWSTPVDLSRIGKRGSDYDMESAAQELSTLQLNGAISEHWLKHARNRPTLFYCCNVQHCHDLCARWEQITGCKGVVITGETPKPQRDAIPAAMESGEIVGVFSCEVYTEGTDIPCISCIVLARPTKSYTLFRQMPGRGLRVHGSKENCVILDHAGWYANFQIMPSDPIPHSLEKGIIKAKKGKPKPKRCRRCNNYYFGAPLECPCCHCELPRVVSDRAERLIEENSTIELQRIEASKKQNPREAYFHRMVDRAYLSNASPETAREAFRKKYNYYPNKEFLQTAPYKMVRHEGKLIWSTQVPKPKPTDYHDVFSRWQQDDN